MSEDVDKTKALAVLTKAWERIGSDEKPPAKIEQTIDVIMGADDITFKYMLITGYLAKAVNPKIHARALQTASKLTGAYDARSLCHGVIVGFEKSKGNLFGLSNEPFVNKPARHPEHDGENKQIRNKVISKQLHTALEAANSAAPNEVLAAIVQILRLGAKRSKEEKSAAIVHKVNLASTVRFIREFLTESDGGARLVPIRIMAR